MSKHAAEIAFIRVLYDSGGLRNLKAYIDFRSVFEPGQFDEFDIFEELFRLGLPSNFRTDRYLSLLDLCCRSSPYARAIEPLLQRDSYDTRDAFDSYMNLYASGSVETIQANLEGFGVHPMVRRGVHLKTHRTKQPAWFHLVFSPLENLLVLCAPLVLKRLEPKPWNLDVLRILRTYLRT